MLTHTKGEIRAIFEKQPFGELERLVTQKLLDVVKKVAKEELESENWLHLVARLSGHSFADLPLEAELEGAECKLSPPGAAVAPDPGGDLRRGHKRSLSVGS